MREICTSGSMSREWKRIVWQAPQARRTTPRHFLTLPLAECPLSYPRRPKADCQHTANLSRFVPRSDSRRISAAGETCRSTTYEGTAGMSQGRAFLPHRHAINEMQVLGSGNLTTNGEKWRVAGA